MGRTICVKGTGKISVKPDLVIVKMEVSAKDMAYAKAVEAVASKIGELEKAIASEGFAKEDLKTTYFNVDEDYETIKQKRVFQGFECTQKVKLEFDLDQNRLGRTLDAIATGSAKPEISLRFGIKDYTEANKELLALITKNAREKAEVLCGASGEKLGQLLSISYKWDDVYVYSETKIYASDSDEYLIAGSSFTPSDITCSDTAVFVWEIG